MGRSLLEYQCIFERSTYLESLYDTSVPEGFIVDRCLPCLSACWPLRLHLCPRSGIMGCQGREEKGFFVGGYDVR